MTTIMKSGADPDDRNGIAIIGLSCHFPGARGPRQLWENVLARRSEFRRMPDRRTPVDQYYSDDPSAVDQFYQQRVAVIDGFKFSWAEYRIPKSTSDITDVAQWLSLDVARRAIEDAGYARGSIPRDRTGVIVGDTCTGEQMRANTMRLRWPFVRRALLAAAQARGLSPEGQEDLAGAMEEVYKSVFPVTNEDLIAGGISATIAGRICNYFDLRGGAYTVDGACASSLIAVSNACELLRSGELDMAIVGGVDISLDPFELVGFSRAGALSRGDMTPYDRRASGFIPGEGCGFVVLQREGDARACGNFVYATIRGWGISSDGKSGIMQPSATGQATAILRAYSKAGYSVGNIAFVEGHGTGTSMGDKTEIEALAMAMVDQGPIEARSCGLTSVKSLIGHTKAAAGMASLIKATIAVNRRVVPPTANCAQPNELFDTIAPGLYPIRFGELREHTETLRAGVSSFGFGGINSHITIESGDAPSPRLAPEADERALLSADQETELFVLGAASVPKLLAQLASLSSEAPRMSQSDMTDLAAQLARDLPVDTPVRAALVASSPDALEKQLAAAQELLRGAQLRDGILAAGPRQAVWLGQGAPSQRIGFMMPGQGSQHLLMARTLVERYEWARELVERADRWISEVLGTPISALIYRPVDRVTDAEELQDWSRRMADTEIAQPAICLASLLYGRFLVQLGIRPAVLGGHSLGELTSFHMAGAFNEESLLKLAALRGLAMKVAPSRAGAMVSLACDRETAEGLVKGVHGVVGIANVNSPRQIVISGEEMSVLDVSRLAAAQGISSRRLNVSNAFHSPLVADAAEELRRRAHLPDRLTGLTQQLISSVQGAVIERGLDLREHFANQVVAPVDFIHVAREMGRACDLIIEVGPGNVLSRLARDILGDGGAHILPIASADSADRDMNTVLACAHALGIKLEWSHLFEPRLVRPFVRPSQRDVIESPTERPFPPLQTNGAAPLMGSLETTFAARTGFSAQELASYFNRRLGFLAEVVKADLATQDEGWSPPAAMPASRAASTRAPALPERAAQAQDRPPRPGGNDLTSLIADVISQRTGYPRSSIDDRQRLLDDLNIDSIKAGEIVGAVAKMAGAAGKLDTARFANASLKEIAEAIRAVSVPRAAAKPAPRHPGHATVYETLLSLVVARTGYPSESIQETARLLDDLNIDSIKAGEIVGAAARHAGAVGKLDPSRFANATLGEIVAAIQEAVDGTSPRRTSRAVERLSSQAPSRLPSRSIQGLGGARPWVRNYAVDLVPEGASGNEGDAPQVWEAAEVLAIAEPDEMDMARAVCEQVAPWGARFTLTTFADGAREQLAREKRFSHIIAILPRASMDGDARAMLARMLRRLLAVASPPPAR